MSRYSGVYHRINKMPVRELRSFATRLAEYAEKYTPYGLRDFDVGQHLVHDVQVRDEMAVKDLVEKLKSHLPLVSQWYYPDHIIIAACADQRTTDELRGFLVYAYGNPEVESLHANINKMIRLVLSIVGMINAPTKVKTETGHTSLRRWRFANNMYAIEQDLIDNFNLRMK